MDYYFEKKYSINGNNIYRRNGEFISRIVQLYRCSKCDHLSQNIVESDVHFQKFHPKNNQIISEKNNIKNNKTLINNKILLNNNQNNNNNNNKDLKIVDKKLNEKKGPKVVDYGLKESKFIINKELNEIINKNFNEIIDRRVDKTVEKINIETGFKDFAEINCVSKLKTYSRKKLPENECEIIDEKFAKNNNNNSNEESVKNAERILRPGLNSCEICGEIYSKSYLSIHMNIHLDPKLCDYPFCEEKFASESQLKQHQQMHVVNDNKRPKERKDRVIREKKFKCDLCENLYTTRRHLYIHRKIHTNPKVCDYPECGKKFSNNSQLKTHKETHNKTYKFKCLICNKIFPYLSRLRVHKSLHTNPVNCEFEGCKKVFCNNTEMKAHSVVHLKDKPFKCDWPGCNFSGKTKHRVKQHKNCNHYKLRAVKCEWKGCERECLSASLLKKHINTVHRNIRDQVCEWPNCGNRYKTKSSLVIHMRRHTGEKPYVCNYPDCDKRFSTSEVLRSHSYAHTGIKPYPCDYCSKSYSASGPLRAHKKLVHKWEKRTNSK